MNVIDPTLPTLEVTLEEKDVTDQVNYKSDNESLATVEKGVVKSKYTGGTANIAVSLEGANSAIFKVNVTDDTKKVALDINILTVLGYQQVYNNDIGKIDVKKITDGEIIKNLEIPAIFTCSGTKYKIISIENSIFSNCTLESVIIPATVTSINTYAFSNCSSLKEINIGDGVLCIFPSAFKGCNNLTQLTPKSSEKIDISDNGYLIKNNVTFIYPKNNTRDVTGNITIPEGVTEISMGAFWGASLTNITIPNTVTTIRENAFTECSSLTSITLPDSVTSIGNSAFSNCTSLTSVIFGENPSLTTIGDYAFRYCGYKNNTYNLTLDIPNSVTTIGENAFFLSQQYQL